MSAAFSSFYRMVIIGMICDDDEDVRVRRDPSYA